jgi:translation initiation factor 1A
VHKYYLSKMPPNKKGGKNYKKGKHDDPDPILYERLPDQMYGRVIKLLGGCNVLVYCNDNRERLCHIRGAMRKKVWLEVSDIVLISLRELDRTGNTSMDSIRRGDICAKYDTRVIYKLKEKDHTINDKLFTIIEKLEDVGQKGRQVPAQDDFGFVFDTGDNQVVNNGGSDSDSDSSAGKFHTNRAAQRKAMDDSDSDVDIDNI